jgi:hypothetical protein
LQLLFRRTVWGGVVYGLFLEMMSLRFERNRTICFVQWCHFCFYLPLAATSREWNDIFFVALTWRIGWRQTMAGWYSGTQFRRLWTCSRSQLPWLVLKIYCGKINACANSRLPICSMYLLLHLASYNHSFRSESILSSGLLTVHFHAYCGFVTWCLMWKGNTSKLKSLTVVVFRTWLRDVLCFKFWSSRHKLG